MKADRFDECFEIVESLPISVKIDTSFNDYRNVQTVHIFRRGDVELLAEVRLSAIKDQAHFLRIYHALQGTVQEDAK